MHAETEISENLIFCSTEVVKSRGRKKIDFYRWLFELPANLCRPICPPGPLGRHWLAGSSEGHWQKSFFFFPHFYPCEQSKISKFQRFQSQNVYRKNFTSFVLISDFHKLTHLPKNQISYVDGPKFEHFQTNLDKLQPKLTSLNLFG